MGIQLDSAIQMAELLIIKRDFDLLKKLQHNLNPKSKYNLHHTQHCFATRYWTT